MDKSMIGDLDSLPEEDKLRMSALSTSSKFGTVLHQIHTTQFTPQFSALVMGSVITISLNFSSLRMYNSLEERCFTDCVDTFRHKSLDKQVESCVRRCAEKFLKHSMRLGMRFAELNSGAPTQD